MRIVRIKLSPNCKKKEHWKQNKSHLLGILPNIGFKHVVNRDLTHFSVFDFNGKVLLLILRCKNYK